MNVSFFRKCLVLTIVFLFVGTSIIPSTGFGTDVSNDPFLGNADIDPTVELTVNDPVIVFGSIQIDENTFTTLEIPNNGFTIIEGEAKLPLIRHMVEIPQNATPEIVVTSVFWNHVSLDEMECQIKAKLEARLIELDEQMKSAKMLSFDAKVQYKSNEIPNSSSILYWR